MKKVDIKEKTMAFNECRQKHENQAFGYEEIQKVLKDAGIPVLIFHMLNKHDVFCKESVDGRTLYSFKKDPIHTSFMERMYNEKRNTVKGWNKSRTNNQPKPQISEQQAWETLVKAGVIKTKFNLNTLKTKYPKIYLECLEYELDVTKQ